MGSILLFLKPIAEFLALKVPVVGAIAANGLAALLAIGILIEIVEAVALITKTSKDDEFVAKAKKVKDKFIAVLEIFPHVNLPIVAAIVKLSAFLVKALAVIKALIGALKK